MEMQERRQLIEHVHEVMQATLPVDTEFAFFIKLPDDQQYIEVQCLDRMIPNILVAIAQRLLMTDQKPFKLYKDSPIEGKTDPLFPQTGVDDERRSERDP